MPLGTVDAKDLLSTIIKAMFGKAGIESSDFPGYAVDFGRSYFTSDRSASKTPYPVSSDVAARLLDLVDLCLDERNYESTQTAINKLMKGDGERQNPLTRSEAKSKLKKEGSYWAWPSNRTSAKLVSVLGNKLGISLDFLAIHGDEASGVYDAKRHYLLHVLEIVLRGMTGVTSVDLDRISEEVGEYASTLVDPLSKNEGDATAIIIDQMRESGFITSRARGGCFDEIESLISGKAISDKPSGKMVRKMLGALGLSDPAALWTLKKGALPNGNPPEMLASIHAVGGAVTVLDIMDSVIVGVPEDSPIEKVNETWFAEFYDKASRARVANVKEMLGKVLAEEVKKPGTIPKKLLWILSVISEEEVEDFRNLSRFAFYDMEDKKSIYPLIFIKDEPYAYGDSGIDTAMLARLNILGLIDVDYLHGFASKRDLLSLRYSSMYFTAHKSDDGRPVPMGNVIFTREGRALFDVINKRSSNKQIADFATGVIARYGCEIRYDVYWAPKVN